MLTEFERSFLHRFSETQERIAKAIEELNRTIKESKDSTVELNISPDSDIYDAFVKGSKPVRETPININVDSKELAKEIIKRHPNYPQSNQ